MGRERVVENALKSWLDHVIIPALVRQYVQTKKVSAPSSQPGDNNGLMNSAADCPEARP